MSTINVLSEGHYFDDAGTLIETYFVDLRDQNSRTPVATLVKRCKRKPLSKSGALSRFASRHITANKATLSQGSGRGSCIPCSLGDQRNQRRPRGLSLSQSRSDALNRGLLLANQSLGEKHRASKSEPVRRVCNSGKRLRLETQSHSERTGGSSAHR